MPSQPSNPQPSNSGIVTDKTSGERKIPESTRPDGTTRKAIKIRPGYRPPEDVEVYKNRTAETFRRGQGVIPGAEGLKEEDKPEQAGANNKNAKRREARRKAKAAGETQDAETDSPATTVPTEVGGTKPDEVDTEVEREKKARNLKKKLKQAKDLKNKKDTGESLLPEQIAKVIKISELVRELDALGFDTEGEPKSQSPAAAVEENPPS